MMRMHALTAAEHRDWMRLTDGLSATLTEAMRERNDRPGLLSNGEPAWVEYERNVMLFAVNRARLERGLPPVDIAEVMRIESGALGHSDYGYRFALRCAELVVAG